MLKGQAITDQPAAKDQSPTSAIGRCVVATRLQPMQQNCAPSGLVFNTEDIALIKLDQGVTSDLEVLGVGPLAGVTTAGALYPQMLVEVAGKVTGLHTLRTGGLSITQQVGINGVAHCFRDLVELRRPSRHYGVTGTVRRPVRPGDSGAWVLRDGPGGKEWCGVVVAGEKSAGYATPAETAMNSLAHWQLSVT